MCVQVLGDANEAAIDTHAEQAAGDLLDATEWLGRIEQVKDRSLPRGHRASAERGDLRFCVSVFAYPEKLGVGEGVT